MHSRNVDFEVVLEIFESHGWKLGKTWGEYRVFVKEGELPWMIPVENRKVDFEYVTKIRIFFGIEGEAR